MNSPCQHFKKCIVNCMENMHTDVRVKNGKNSVFSTQLNNYFEKRLRAILQFIFPKLTN